MCAQTHHRHLDHDEPGLGRAVGVAGQPEGVIPASDDGGARLSDDLRKHADVARVHGRARAGQEDDGAVAVVGGSAEQAEALGLPAESLEVGAGDGWRDETRRWQEPEREDNSAESLA